MDISKAYSRTSKYHDLYDRFFAMVSLQIHEFWKCTGHKNLFRVPENDYRVMKATAYYEIIRRTRGRKKIEEFVSDKHVKDYVRGAV